MLENMSGFVGEAMHTERQRQTRQGMQVGEATRGRTKERSGTKARVLLATALVALATRIAPSVTTGRVAPAQ